MPHHTRETTESNNSIPIRQTCYPSMPPLAQLMVIWFARRNLKLVKLSLTYLGNGAESDFVRGIGISKRIDSCRVAQASGLPACQSKSQTNGSGVHAASIHQTSTWSQDISSPYPLWIKAIGNGYIVSAQSEYLRRTRQIVIPQLLCLKRCTRDR